VTVIRSSSRRPGGTTDEQTDEPGEDGEPGEDDRDEHVWIHRASRPEESCDNRVRFGLANTCLTMPRS
jgi:hypothetical protein